MRRKCTRSNKLKLTGHSARRLRAATSMLFQTRLQIGCHSNVVTPGFVAEEINVKHSFSIEEHAHI